MPLEYRRAPVRFMRSAGLRPPAPCARVLGVRSQSAASACARAAASVQTAAGARSQADAKHRDEQRMLADERDVLHQEMSRIQNRLKLTLQVCPAIPRHPHAESHGARLAAAATRVPRAVLPGTRRAARGVREYLE